VPCYATEKQTLKTEK